MAYLEWSEDLNTNIDIIDQQHKCIVQYINELYDAQRTHDRTKIGNVIDKLIDYITSHFNYEENLMKQAEYPLLKLHKETHDLFVKKISKILTQYASRDDVGPELLSMLQKWLFNHIKNEDGDYAPTVLAKMGENS